MYFLSIPPLPPPEYEPFTAATSNTPAKLPVPQIWTATGALHDAVGLGTIRIPVFWYSKRLKYPELTLVFHSVQRWPRLSQSIKSIQLDRPVRRHVSKLAVTRATVLHYCYWGTWSDLWFLRMFVSFKLQMSTSPGPAVLQRWLLNDRWRCFRMLIDDRSDGL